MEVGVLVKDIVGGISLVSLVGGLLNCLMGNLHEHVALSLSDGIHGVKLVGEWLWLLRHLVPSLLNVWMKSVLSVDVLPDDHLLHVLLGEVSVVGDVVLESLELGEMSGH